MELISSTCLFVCHHLFLLFVSTSGSADAAISKQHNESLTLEAEDSLNLIASNISDQSGSSLSSLNQTFADYNSSYVPSLNDTSGECVRGQHRRNGTCTSIGKQNVLSYLVQALPFLPILIVLSLLFAGLCLVLRLFSKARFRNNRSSIFVNPQTLKVAQAQERRLSQLSQLSGSGMRTPRTPTWSPINSNRSTRSSFGSNVYPINDPVTLHSPNSVLMKEKSRSNSISSSKLLP